MGSMSIMHWAIVIGVVVLLFGRGKISGLMGDVAQGMKSFRRGLREDDAETSPPSPGTDAQRTAPFTIAKREDR